MLTALQHLKSLRDLELACFSGELHLSNAADQQWTFYLFQGQIVYATGGLHPVRRWRRQLMTVCPHLPTYRLAWQVDLAKIEDAKFVCGWEYALLKYWVNQEKISTQHTNKIIQTVVDECLFEIIQETHLSFRTEPNRAMVACLETINTNSAVTIAEQRWEKWQLASLGGCSPNQSPILKRPHFLRQISLDPDWRDLAERLTGQTTLYDLAVETNRSVIDVATFLLPFVQSDWVELIPIPDLPAPIYRQRLFNRPVPPPPTTTPHKGALIACIDDSSLVRNMVEQVVTAADYQFVGIEDPMRAIGTLLAQKPALIFLDLMMPHIGGYELCEQFRKVSCFKSTPIIILTGNDGYVNRLRSNFAGASDFLTKPLDADVLLGVIHKYLNQGK